jgi:hypothetical protein
MVQAVSQALQDLMVLREVVVHQALAGQMELAEHQVQMDQVVLQEQMVQVELQV